MIKIYNLKSRLGLCLSVLAICLSFSMKAQLSGVKTIPTDYPTLAAAIADINLQGVNGALIVNIPAGFTETAPVGGFSLTATGTIANTITFQKSGAGANPLLTAYAGGVGTPGTATQDGVFKLIGSDFITIDGIDINDPNAANPATMEYGYALYKASVGDGCQNNTIKNCMITLNRINNATGTTPMVEGSVGIIMMNATASAATTNLTPTLATGTNSNNKFYSNTIQNCNYGIALIGFAAASPFTLADTGNDIGGFSTTTGNTILNYGGGAVTNPAAGIRTLAQYSLNVSFNTINNNNGSGVNHANILKGIYINTATSANVAITNNTITVKSGATTSALSAIENASGSTAASNTVAIVSNVITNCTYTTATTGTFNGILNSSTPAVTIINNNMVSNTTVGNSGVASSAILNGIYNSGSTGTNPVAINSNTITNSVINNQGGTNYGIRASTAAITVNNNIINNLSIPSSGGALAGVIYGYYNFGSPTIENYNNNKIDNLIISGASTSASSIIRGIYSNTTGSTILNSSNNTIQTLTYNNSSTGAATVYGLSYYLGTMNISKNKIYAVTANGANSSAAGFFIGGGTTVNLFNNIVGDIKTPSANAANPLAGINIAGGTTVNAYYNTVHLNAVSSGALFGSSAIFASTTPAVDLRNNIFVNLSAQTGTGTAVAYRRSGSTITSYATTSNNNLFYSGTPTPKNLIFSDGTNDYITLSSFQTAMVNRDQTSVTENPNFLSITGSAANFLHINPATATTIEGGAANIATYTDDYDGDIRQGNAGYAGTGTSPDIGADEFNGTTPAPSINALAISPIGNKCVAVARVITATVTPGSSNLTTVSLIYSFNGVVQPTVTMTGGSLSSASSWTGNIPVAIPTNANVTWYVSVTDGTYTKTSNGTSYKDEPLVGVVAQATASLSTICSGSTSTLTPSFGNPNSAALSALPPAVSSPTTDEDFGGIIFGTLTNSTAINSLVGSIGTANGVAGSYSDFTAFGPYAFTAGNSYSLSLTSLQAATAYGNAFGVYIDYNRNGVFTDAGEAVYASTVTTLGTHTETTSIIIPASAKNGLTRMRVVVNEGLVTGPTMAISWGEYEEYMLNISSVNQGGGSVPTFTAYAWNDGASSVATTSVAALSPTTTTTYSIIATDANGCSVTSSPVTVTVVPVPTIPTVTNTSQCGVAASNSSVGGGTSYNWYSTATSTTVLQSGATSTYTTPISTTSTFYVVSDNGVCLSPRAAVTTSVSLPDPILASASATAICPGNSVLLSSTQGTVNVYTFTWTATPAAGSGIPTSIAGNTVNVTPTTAGTYVYQVYATDGICSTTSSVTVILSNPPTITATANPNIVCSTASVNLNATTPVVATGTAVTGTGTSLTSTSGYPTAFGNYWYQTWQQYLFTASELTAMGIYPGNITSLAFKIAATPSPNTTITDYNVKIATTTNTALSTFVTSGLTNVYGPTSVTAAVGLNTITLSTPYNWDGVSNIIIDLRQTEFYGSGNATTYYTATTNNSVLYAYSTSSNPTFWTSSPAPTTSTSRPNITFAGQVATQGAGGMVWQWNPGAINTNTAVVNPINTGTAPVTQNYTVTATDPVTTCSNTAVVAVLVNPLPATPTAANSTQCGLGIPTAAMSGGSLYNWYSTATSTTVLQAGTSSTFTSSINSTTSWYVSSYNGTCESPRVILTTTVNIPDAVTASSTSTMVCPGATYTLTATKAGSTNNYIYTWTATPAVGSGMATSVSGATAVVNPVTAGTYAYLVTAVDGTCTTTASINVTLNNPPAISASATPTAVCSSNSVTLNALSIAATSSTAATGLQTTTSITGGPYRQGAGSDNKAQYLFTVAELTAAGFAPGNITGLSFSVTSNGVGTMNNFTIKMGNTASTTLSTAYDAAPPVVLGPIAYTTIAGLNTHTFATPFYWNGSSNVIVEVCHDIVSGGSSSTIGQETISNRVIYSNVTGACALTIGNANTIRPIITFAGQVGTNVTSSMNFVWNPGSIATNTAIVNPINTGTTAVTQTYTATVTNTLTGCTNFTTVSVVVNPIPVTPTAFNSTQCGVAVPTASFTGGTSYNWYATPTSTIVLQAGTSATYSSSISSTTNFYVSSFNGNCESPRAMVTASVTSPDAVTASISSPSVCPNTSVTLTAANTGTTNTYSYTWTGSPATGSGIPTSVSGTIVNITPTLAGNYVYTLTAVDGLCTAVSTVSLNVFTTSTVTPIASANPSVMCVGNTTTLSVTASGPIALGTGSTTTQGGSGLSPYAQFYEGQRTQYLFTASELASAGLGAGNITSMSFSVTSALASITFTNYAIKMYHTAATDLVSSYATASGAVSNVYGPLNLAAPTLGINTHNFSSPFTWDGTSNVIVDICFENDPSSIGTLYTSNTIVAANTVAGFTSVRGDYADNSSLCNTANTGSSATSADRPNVIFMGNKLSGITSFNWSAGGSSVGTGSVLAVTPTVTSVYTATLTDINSCTSISTPVTVTVNPLPVINATTPSSIVCANSSATLSATGATTYTWAPTGGNAASAVVTPSANTTYTVTGSLLGCISTNTVSLATTPSPTLNVVASATSAICAGTTATLTTSGTATSFTWTPAVSTTSMAVVTPTANATYTVVGFDAGCTTTKTISLAVTANPTVNLVATNTVICIGSTTSSTINATGTATSFTWIPAVSTTSTAVVSPTSTASYTVVGLASGCTTTKTITVSVANTPTVTAIAPNNVICAGSTATLTSIGTATNYTWSPVGGNGASAVVTPTTATTYTLIGSASGCTNSSIVTLTVSALPIVTATSSSSAICTGESAVLTASTSATSYTWSNTANTVSTTVTPTITSNYTVTVSNGTCTANATVAVVVNACIGIEELSSNGISIYPNPTIDKLNIAINADLVSITSVSIYDALGKLVMTEKLNTELTTIRTSNLDSGVYFVKIISNNREIKIGKLVKQ
jgi:hypothetical protein